MNKHKRTYLEMQLEDATLASGRYNTDFNAGKPDTSAASTLVGAYRKAAISLGLPFGETVANQGTDKLSGSH